MWNSCFQKMKEDEERAREAEKRNVSTAQIKIEEAERRLSVLKGMHFLGGNSVEEFKALEQEIKELKREDDYSRWFKENHDLLEDLFDTMFNFFIEGTEKIFILKYDSNTDKYLVFKNQVLREDFLTDLLRRYDYHYKAQFWNEKKIGLKISYKKGEV